jgi:hypothetical protein
MLRRRRALIVSMVSAMAGSLPLVAAFGPALEREWGQTLVFQLRGAVPAPDGVVVVAQDYASAQALGLPPKLERWPRSHLAELIRRRARPVRSRSCSTLPSMHRSRRSIRTWRLPFARAAVWCFSNGCCRKGWLICLAS